MPLFASKKQQKKQTTFSPDHKEMTTQKQNFYDTPQQENKQTMVEIMAQYNDPADLLDYFFNKIDKTIDQLNQLYDCLMKIDEFVKKYNEVLESDASEKTKLLIKDNRDCMLEVRQKNIKAFNVMANDLIQEEYVFNKRRLDLEKPYFKMDNKEEDWQAYVEQISLQSKVSLIEKLKQTKCSAFISIPEEVNLMVLESKREKLTEEERAEKAKAETVVEFNRTCEEIKSDRDTYEFNEIERMSKAVDIIKCCETYKETYWDRNREEFLNPQNLNQNLRKYLAIAKIADKFLKEYRSRKLHYTGEQRKRIFDAKVKDTNLEELNKKRLEKKVELTKEELAPLEEIGKIAKAEGSRSLDNLKDVMRYMQLHINNMFADLGKEIKFNKALPEIVDLAVEKNNLVTKQRMWNDDRILYEKLVNPQPQAVREASAEVNDESRLAAFEAEIGVAADPQLKLENIQIDRNKIATKDEEDFKQSGFIRLNQYYMTNISNSRYDVIKVSRMKNIMEALIGKIENERLGNDNLKKINELFTDYIKKMNSNVTSQKDYITYTNNLWESVKNRIYYIIKYSNSYREKQCAANFSRIMLYLGRGELNYKEKVNYEAKDHFFHDMENNVTISKITGEDVKCIFMPQVDQPLFEHEPCLMDIKQGTVGDCYLLASLASIISTHPEKIKKMMQDNLDGTVTVRFFDTDEKKTPIYVKVAKSVPVYLYASGKTVDAYNNGPLWLKMIEKAYACVRLQDGYQQRSDFSIYRTDRLRTTENRLEYRYDNIEGGYSHETLKHLTGEDTERNRHFYREIDLRIFESRMDKIDAGSIRPGWDVLSFLFFKHKHTNDEPAHRYLANNKAKNKAYEKEFKRYHHFYELLENTLIIKYGQDALKSMNSKDFIDALNGVLHILSMFIDVIGTTPSDFDLKEAGLPEEAIKYFKKCWKDYSQNGTAFYDDISLMVSLFNADYRQRVAHRNSEYTQVEDEIFNKIKEKLDNKKSVVFETTEFKSFDSKIKGASGEKFKDGMYATHAYAVVDVKEIEFNGVMKKWLIVQNPHGTFIPVYKLNDDGSIKRINRNERAEEDIYDEKTHGVFLLELRDACQIIDRFNFVA